MTAAHLVLGAVYVSFAALSCVLAAIDVKHHRLPNALVLPSIPAVLLLFAVACVAGADWARLTNALLGGMALFAFYLVLSIARPSGLGGGDVKLAGLVGIILGWTGWTTVAIGALAGFALGGVFGLALIVTRRADGRTRIPFGPFMLGGAWLALAVSTA